ncbi:phage terminase large subunit family protein [Azospirillum brasilense]|nr:phage terminase large subunit family protein [Azospirillum brasilense]
MEELEHPYADPWAIADDSLSVLEPPKRQTVAEFAEEHPRLLANEGGGYVGRFRCDQAPYLREPMECLTSLDYLTIAVPGPGQSAKTTIAENWLLHSVASNPGNLLWYMQTDDGVEAYVKQRINPMIDAHEVMASRLGKRPVDDSLHFKNFRTMRTEFLPATKRNLINKSAPRIVADEIDAWTIEGDVKAMLDVRRQTFGRQSKILALSHPDKAKGLNPVRDWTSGIMAMYADSDRRVWYWQCPDCGAWSSPAPRGSRVMALDYPEEGTLDEVEAEARLVCPVNQCRIEDAQRREMNATGRWIGDGQIIAENGTVTGELVKRKTAGFWIVGAMSPFVLGGIGALARAKAKAERELEVSGEEETLRQVMVKQFGVPYSPPRSVNLLQGSDIADRATVHLHLGVVPEGVRFITAFWDVQIAHFDILFRGWGVNGESWVIDRQRIGGDPATSPEDWDKLLDEVVLRTFPLADGSGRHMGVRGVGYDSQGQPGVSQQAYDAWTRWRTKKAVKFIGKIAGRDVFSVIPTKGANGLMAPRLTVTYPDTSGDAAKKFGSNGTVPVAMFNPNTFKDDLNGQLQKADDGPWAVHFPSALRAKSPPHPWFEQLVAEKRQANGRWEKESRSARNEALDTMVGNHVVAHLHGLNRINWQRPPSWAAPWDENSMVTVPEPDEPAPEAIVIAPAAPAAAPPPDATKPRLAGRLASRLAG